MMNDEYHLLANGRMSFLDISANRIVRVILLKYAIKFRSLLLPCRYYWERLVVLKKVARVARVVVRWCHQQRASG